MGARRLLQQALRVCVWGEEGDLNILDHYVSSATVVLMYLSLSFSLARSLSHAHTYTHTLSVSLPSLVFIPLHLGSELKLKPCLT